MLSCILTNRTSLSFLSSFIISSCLKAYGKRYQGTDLSISVGEKSLSIVDIMVQRKTNGSNHLIDRVFDNREVGENEGFERNASSFKARRLNRTRVILKCDNRL